MNKLNGNMYADGFHKLDSNLVEERPPKIHWGVAYRSWKDEVKIKYLENLASSMNHAAHLIQIERNRLLKLCKLQEEQIKQMNGAVKQNNEMLQSEVTRMNSQRQDYHANIAKLNAQIRELQSGNHD